MAVSKFNVEAAADTAVKIKNWLALFGTILSKP
jgi:hypothetical protein